MIAAVGALALAVLAGWALGSLTSRPSVPGEGSAEAGFARDMQTHHLQAVDMSMIVRDRTEDPAIDQLAYDIARSQQQQAGQMYGWLSLWGLPQASTQPAMAWMNGAGHSTHNGTAAEDGAAMDTAMPGMATAEELAEFKAASGVEAERLYLELMIEHHKAGVTMAEALLPRTDIPAVESLAQSIVTAQQSEITYMDQLLSAR
ncbi:MULTISPECIES: DUF305 domain-containing protein [Micrococcaceae]|jgi:uncharacterized protein (DUF305 family)|uniref:DUF305 domain-containing protein n=3 Tax=Micrococcaceae TaxID=1268 RepID=Q6SK75_PAEAU|nr:MULTISPECIES: DUF305 domain-containing protein [Micrococcaceae]AAS20097.1 hypothetical protein [Paenarthrobacter aurescens]SDQ03304.1 Uncharacterized conserved protein, DUF305 family [Arthrobacter crystallopoietes]